MRTLPPALKAHLDTNETTLAWCWRMTRADGAVFGFTNHDKDLTFNGTLFSANSGMFGTEIQTSLGLSVDNMDVSGALNSSEITETELRTGAYDGAKVEVFLVNWNDLTQTLLIKTGTIGEVTRGQVAFQAEFRGLSQQLQQKKGRIYQYGCDVGFGSAKCGLNTNSAAFKGNGTVESTNGSNTIVANGLSAFGSGWFSSGLLRFTSGPNNGRALEVKVHTVVNGVVSITLWEQTPFNIAPNNTFEIIAGCDKSFKTCKTKFANQANYRGFPYIPGADYITNYAVQGATEQNGGSMFN